MAIRAFARAALSALAVVLVAACGVSNDEFDDMAPAAGTDRVVFHIENQATAQATIYMIQDGGMRIRVGEVPALGERFFDHDVWLGRSIQFDVRMLAGGTFRTSSVPVARGDTVHVRIPPHL